MKSEQIANIFFSPNGEAKKIAEYFGKELNIKNIDLTKKQNRLDFNAFQGDFCIITIPVYSNNIPLPMRSLLSKLQYRYTIINITYGGFSKGNVLYKVKKALGKTVIIGYSITPVSHSYIQQDIPVYFSEYDLLIKRIQDRITNPVLIRWKPSIYPYIFEQKITDWNFQLRYDKRLCTHCNICVENCPVSAISPNIELPKSCIKCGACVNACPTKAISSQTSWFLKLYFRRKQKASVIIR